MNPSDLQTLQYAVALAQSGQRSEAHTLLSHLAAAYPNDSNVLLWFAFTSSDLSRARNSLNRVAQLDPTNPSLKGALQWLAQQEAAQANTPPASAYRQPEPNPAQAGYSGYGGNREQVVYRFSPPGLFERIGMAWEFIKQAVALARNDPGLLKPAFFALGVKAFLLVVGGLVMVAAFLMVEPTRNDGLAYAVFTGISALMTFGMFAVTYHFSAQIIHLVYQKLTEGTTDTKRAALATDRKFWVILKIALVSTLISVVRNLLSRRNSGIFGYVAAFIMRLIENVWTVATYFILPAVMIEDREMGEATGRATQIIKGNLLQVGISYVGLTFVLGFITNTLGLLVAGVAFAVLFGLLKVSVLVGVIICLGVVFAYFALTSALTSYLKTAYYTCMFLWVREIELYGEHAAPPAPLRTALQPFVYRS